MADADLRELERAAAVGGPEERIRLSVERCRSGDHAWSKWKRPGLEWDDLHREVNGEEAVPHSAYFRQCFWCGASERRINWSDGWAMLSDGTITKRRPRKVSPPEADDVPITSDHVALGRGRSFERMPTIPPNSMYTLTADPPADSPEPFFLNQLRISTESPGLRVTVRARSNGTINIVAGAHLLEHERELELISGEGLPVGERIFITIDNTRSEEAIAHLSLSGIPLGAM